jgi:hypothetical protein
VALACEEETVINVAFVFLGIIIAMIGVFIPLTPPPETENERAARAVRAFFKGYTDSHQVSYIGKLPEGGWEIHVRDLNDPSQPYSAVPTRLLLQLSDETKQTTPWTKIVVDPAKEPNQ